MQILEGVSLKTYNTFGIDVKAAFFSEVSSEEALLELLAWQKEQDIPLLVLGGGSNVLLSKDFAGLVLKMAIKDSKVISEDDDSVLFSVGAGVNWHQFVMYCVAQGYGGVENLSLIPGTVGAAPMQNIGAYGVEVKDTFHSLHGYNLEHGTFEQYFKEDCEFGYRTSIFKTHLKDKFIITRVNFTLNKKHILNTNYGAIGQALSEQGRTEFTIADVAEAVINIRKSKLPDPAVVGNAGSFFKNPIVEKTFADELLMKYPEMPSFKTENLEYIKLSAAWLIEQCGWKGKRIGDAGTYPKHALVLVNFGNATGAELMAVALQIQKDVLDKFKVEIHPEVNWV